MISKMSELSRKSFLTASLAAAFAPFRELAAQAPQKKVSVSDVIGAEKLAGIELTEEQRKSVVQTLNSAKQSLEDLRKLGLSNSVQPAFGFSPKGKKPQPGKRTELKLDRVSKKTLPKTDEEIAFASLAELGYYLRTKQISSVRLTEIYLERLKRYSPKLLNVITITDRLALQQATQADKEIQAGKLRGPLHGIPYGIKDLFAQKDYRTTWGAEPFRDQLINHDAAVLEKLNAAGAIMVAKTSVGALAYGDLWFGGLTKNPWNSNQGSSGSSAGSASGTAAGLFAFSIGTETLGSIVSPSQRCRVTGLRPTFGRVSRYGAMALSWSMDKVGPICRSAEDCAVVLSAIFGSDERDNDSVDFPFLYRSNTDLKKLKLGFVSAKPLDEDDVTTALGIAGDILKSLGVSLKAVKVRPPLPGVDEVLTIEAAAAFEDITRDGRVDSMKGSLWPPIFRSGLLMSGVDYIQASRGRTLLQKQFEEDFADFDALIALDRAGDVLITTNLTGHPQIYVPLGVNDQGRPVGISIIGRLYDEATILSIAHQIQAKSNLRNQKPDLSKL